jgi:Tol biopolymer transport system component
VTGPSAERLILRVDNSSVVPRGWSRDLAWIVFSRVDPGTKWNVFRVPGSGSGAPVALVKGPAIEVASSLSPDNRWLSYLSDQAGHLDLYVQSFPDGGARTQVVAAGGIRQSWWTPDGRHLLYLKRDQSLWRVGIDLRVAPPRIDPPVQLGTFPPALVAMDLAADGRQFLAVVPERAGLGAVTIVQNWHAALPARLR